jgi:hypothetical protein
MIDDIIVIDNVIPQQYQDDIEYEVLKGNFPWWYQFDNAFSPLKNNVKKYPSFNHQLAEYDIATNASFLFLKPVAFFACEQIGFKIKEFVYVKSCLQVPLIMDSPDRSNNPHVDLPYPHLVCLYYANDSDGETIIYDKIAKDNDTVYNKSELTIKKSVEPKKGRVVMFNGQLLHNSTTPALSPRCIVNFDLV